MDTMAGLAGHLPLRTVHISQDLSPVPIVSYTAVQVSMFVCSCQSHNKHELFTLIGFELFLTSLNGLQPSRHLLFEVVLVIITTLRNIWDAAMTFPGSLSHLFQIFIDINWCHLSLRVILMHLRLTNQNEVGGNSAVSYLFYSVGTLTSSTYYFYCEKYTNSVY